MQTLFRFKAPQDSKFRTKLTPAGSVGASGKWFEPDGDGFVEGKGWNFEELTRPSEVSRTMSSKGRYQASTTVSPTSGGSGTLVVWVEEPGGTVQARPPVLIDTTATIDAFIHVK